jgi:hypothetical protein
MWPHCTAMGGRLADSREGKARQKIPASWDSPAVAARVWDKHELLRKKNHRGQSMGISSARRDGTDEMCRIRYWRSFVARCSGAGMRASRQ